MMQIKHLQWAFVLLLFTGISFISAAQSDTGFTEDACAFELPPETGLVEGETVFCGIVQVPEQRGADDSPMISLAVTRVRTGEVTDEPVIFLGEAGVSTAFYLTRLAPLLDSGLPGDINREFVFIDARGSGASTPSLSCEAEAQASSEETFNFNEACRQRLESEGIDLQGYTRSEIAADVDAVRTALGYDQVNLYAHGRGTLLAQDVIRAYPDTIRSAVFESTLSPDAPVLGRPAALSGALIRVFELCESSPICSGAYPGAGSAFQALVEATKSGAQTLSNTTFLNVAYLLLNGTQGEINVPFFVNALETGNQAALLEVSNAARAEALPPDAQFSGLRALVSCADALPFASEDSFDAFMADALPEVREVFALSEKDRFVDNCANWPVVELDESAREPLESDVPSLFLTGSLDPNTTVETAARTAGRFANSTVITVEGFGAWVLGRGNTCAINLYTQFVIDPASRLYSACVNDLSITFRLPVTEESTGSFSLEPLVITREYFSSVVPPDWSEVDNGVFVSSTGQALVAFTFVEGDDIQQTLNDFIAGELAEPELHSTLSANGLDWQIYTTSSEDRYFALALSTDGINVYLVLVQSLTDNLDTLIELVVNPALEAYQLTGE